jgi:hypothetical protein
MRYGKILHIRTDHSRQYGHAHCILDTKVYKHTLRICNTHCFSTATMVRLTHINATLYVYYFTERQVTVF